jgi:uncharacterized protein (DUF305 family)
MVDLRAGLGDATSGSATVIDLRDAYVPDRRRAEPVIPSVVLHLQRQWSRGMVAVAVVVAMVAAVAGLTAGRLTGVRPALSAVERGFLQAMLDHHDQTVRMALTVQARSKIGVVGQDAAELVSRQRYEIGVMETMLADAGYERDGSDRVVLDWNATNLADPPAPGVSLAVLEDAEGTAFDRLYLSEMRAHQEAGGGLAGYAALRSDHAAVRSLALNIGAAESSGAAECTYLLRTFGFE